MNYTAAREALKCPEITTEEFEIYWRQCAQYRFKEINDSDSIDQFLERWPEYTKQSAIHWVIFEIYSNNIINMMINCRLTLISK